MVNGNRRSTRNRKSNSQPVSRAAFNALKARLDPDIKAVPTSGQPRPVVGPGDFWISRRVQITLNGTASTVLNLTVGDIIKQISSAAGTYPLRICAVTAYGPMGGSLTCTLNIDNIGVATDSLSPLTASDYGSATRMPGLRFTVPKLASKVIGATSASSTVVAAASWTGGTAPTLQGSVVYEVDITFQLP